MKHRLLRDAEKLDFVECYLAVPFTFSLGINPLIPALRNDVTRILANMQRYVYQCSLWCWVHSWGIKRHPQE